MQNTEVDSKAEEVREVEGDTTKVKVRFTIIKFFNEDANEINDLRLIGKMSAVECKKHIKSLNSDNVYITKSNDFEEFEVNTVDLYQLKAD